MTNTRLDFDPYDATIEFDPWAPDAIANPYPLYTRLRNTAPVWKSPLGFWILTRYDDVTKFFNDNSLRREFDIGQKVRQGEEVGEQPYYQMFRHMLVVIDDPAHKRIRRLLQPAFTARRISNLRSRIEELADELIDRVAAKRELDLVSDYAARLPKHVIGELLGIPREDQIMIGDWTDQLVPAFEIFPMTPEVVVHVNEYCKKLYDYFSDMAVQRIKDPQDDVMTTMVQATTEDDDRFTRDELIANAVLLYVGGQDTTAGALSMAILNLHRNPDQLELLRNDLDMIPAVIDELLRFDVSAGTTFRVSPEPVVFSGVEIPAGEPIAGFLRAGMHDPAVFPDPDKLDLKRDLTGKKTAFGGGMWMCIGHALARAELEISLDTLLRRCPDLKLATLDPPYRPSPVMRGLESLPASW